MTSLQQAFVNLRSGRPTPLQPPVAGYEQSLSFQEKAMLAEALAYSAVGSPPTVHKVLQEFAARTGADEIMIASMIFDHAARLRSYEIAAQAL
jgi:alkanesulfonate monooxygenase SsuD/methylene tetrahydromethanopterin reductase-like flavin-dependent oxidoreductase (luciferase family)